VFSVKGFDQIASAIRAQENTEEGRNKDIFKKSKTTGRVMDNKIGVGGLEKSVITPENIAALSRR
jgi:hypothetical protein